jgi:hypothetical protein
MDAELAFHVEERARELVREAGLDLDVARALIVVGLATVAACLAPAWRVVRVDPTVSLRID